MSIGAAIGGIASAVIGGSSAKKAAKAQQAAADQQAAVAREIYYDQKEQFAPYNEESTNAMAALLYEMDLGERPVFGAQQLEVTSEQYENPAHIQTGWDETYSREHGVQRTPRYSTQQPMLTRYRVGDNVFDTREAADTYAVNNSTGGREYGGFQESPGYQFRLGESQRAVEASAARRHGLVSGAAQEALARNAQDYASNEYGNYYNRLAGIAGMGQASAAGTASAAGQYGSNSMNALANRGDAAASGAIGVGNALQGGLNNGLALYAYGQQQPLFGGGGGK